MKEVFSQKLRKILLFYLFEIPSSIKKNLFISGFLGFLEAEKIPCSIFSDRKLKKKHQHDSKNNFNFQILLF